MSRPLTVILDLTERCNLKCVMCYFSATDRLRFPPYEASLSEDGNMPLPVFERIAAEFFPRAWRVALGCATEPMMHPKFKEIVTMAGRYKIPDLWFPTNLLALTEASAEAIVRAGVNVVGVSIDGMTRETYEKIRVGGKWDRLMSRIQLLNDTRRALRKSKPKIRFIFTWMKSNRRELGDLPPFAEAHGAKEIDVRYVSPTAGVDNTAELLSGEDRRELNAELAATARDAVRRGLKLASYPEFESPEDRPRDLIGRLSRRLWLLRAGIDRIEYRRHARQERRAGCAYPDRTFVIRPNGAVYPCIFWDEEPLGLLPAETCATLAGGEALQRIREGLLHGTPIGTCARCGERRDALYRPSRIVERLKTALYRS
jgi:MoaA/NifB/PqqE/SkfB family radical SAM enzyme